METHVAQDMQVFHLGISDNEAAACNNDIDLNVVQPVELNVPSLEVDIDHPFLGLVEVQGLHHLVDVSNGDCDFDH